MFTDNSLKQLNFNKSRSTAINTVLYLVLIMNGAGIPHPHRLFINVTVGNVTRLSRTNSRRQWSPRTQLGLTSGPLATLTYTTDVL